jgi:hypothetical protein
LKNLLNDTVLHLLVCSPIVLVRGRETELCLRVPSRQARTRQERVPKPERVSPRLSPHLQHVHMVGSRLSLDEVVAARDSVFSSMLVAQELHRRNAHAGLFEAHDLDQNVQHRLRGHTGEGCASHMLNAQDVRPYGLEDALTFFREFVRPGGVFP